MCRLLACLIALTTAFAIGCASDPPGTGDNDVQSDTAGDTGDDPSDLAPDSTTDPSTDPSNDGTVSDQPDTTPDQSPDAVTDPTEDGGWPSCVPLGSEVCNNGYDDDCDGDVDEGCSCSPQGDTQFCYPGNPAHLTAANTTCQPGLQTCNLEFWTECQGAIGPEFMDYCGDLQDNNCNGEIDEGCSVTDPVAICPADSTGPVLAYYNLLGQYSDPNSVPMATATWSMLSAPPGHSYDVTTSGLELTFFADVTGEYRFKLTVENTAGGSDSCETLFTATTEDLLRIELTWNRPEGNDDPCPTTDKTDLDLHLHRNATGNFQYYQSADNCYWYNCATCSEPYGDDLGRERVCRAFISDPPEGTCTEDQPCPPPRLHWGSDSNLLNDPRLDLDDVEGCGPENINIREPANGTYRVAVHFYDTDQSSGTSINASVRVRIICQGSEIWLFEPVTMNATGEYLSTNDFWEAGQITINNGVTPPTLPCTFAQFGTSGARRICDFSDGNAAGCPP